MEKIIRGSFSVDCAFNGKNYYPDIIITKARTSSSSTTRTLTSASPTGPTTAPSSILTLKTPPMPTRYRALRA